MKARGAGNSGNYRNPCLTMHQPWASLLVHGIKRIEGRSWPAPISGRLWIHAASKIPEAETIKAMEEFYREIYAVNGITDIEFPQHYPVSRLLGCVEVVGCLKREELVSWEALPESVRLEGLTDFCWLCECPQKLTIPFEMRGYQGVYNLEKRIFEAAFRGLRPIEGPQPVKFPLPDPNDASSLKPGSLALRFTSSRVSAVEKPPSVNAAIAGARAAASQFSKKDQTKSTRNNHIDVSQNNDSEGTSQNISTAENRKRDQTKSKRNTDQNSDSEGTSQNISTAENCRLSQFPIGQPHQDDHDLTHVNQQINNPVSGGSVKRRSIGTGRGFTPQSGAPSSKLFAAALRGLALN